MAVFGVSFEAVHDEIDSWCFLVRFRSFFFDIYSIITSETPSLLILALSKAFQVRALVGSWRKSEKAKMKARIKEERRLNGKVNKTLSFLKNLPSLDHPDILETEP